MSGFDKEWLELREPADRRARDALLLRQVAELIGYPGEPHVLDIGCGTGSTYRALKVNLDGHIRWSLFDYDESLLAEARRRHGADEIRLIQGDLNALAALPLDGVSLVTASALFDLCSPDFIERLVRRLRNAGAGLYAALNYDGEMSWSIPHPLDEAVTKAFNEHQRTDKGFGMSAGPDAWKALASCLQGQGYEVRTASSPWLMDYQDYALQLMFLKGVADAVVGQGTVFEDDLKAWHRFRRDAVTDTASSCRVGHQDVLALLYDVC